MAEQRVNELPAGLLAGYGHGAFGNREPVRDLLTADGIMTKTVIREDERVLLAQLRALCDAFYGGKGALLKFIEDFEKYGVSVDGKSREEFKQVHVAMGPPPLNGEPPMQLDAKRTRR